MEEAAQLFNVIPIALNVPVLYLLCVLTIHPGPIISVSKLSEGCPAPKLILCISGVVSQIPDTDSELNISIAGQP